MAEQTKFLTGTDGTKLFVRQNTPTLHPKESVGQYKAAILLVHGFGEHSGRYTHVADFFNQNGYALIAFDNRGHGKSDGKRGHAPRFESYMDDIETVLQDAQKALGSTPLFLYGHSMGGNLVLNYIIRRKPEILRGAIATGPWIQLAFEPKPIMITIGKLMRSIFPTFTQSAGVVADHISKDPEVVKAYKNDPLVHSKITASAGIGLNESAAFLNTHTGVLPVPCLILHADEDKLTAQPASEAFAKRVQNVDYKIWAGMYHEIHNEPNKAAVLNYILGWMDARLD
jgi:alpha-beta hydrolase superfamily lysophospholipase